MDDKMIDIKDLVKQNYVNPADLTYETAFSYSKRLF